MIRRPTEGGFYLIAQQDHARLSGQLAEYWGSDHWPAPRPREAVLAAIHHHDDGWPRHDQQPTLDDEQLPTDFYKMSPDWDLKLWSGSIEQASDKGGPMGGLIVSWHFCALADLLPIDPNDRNMLNQRDAFKQAEQQRRARFCDELGLSKTMANAEPAPQTEADREAVYNFRVLRAVDWLSLVLCADELPEEMAAYPPAIDPEGKYQIVTTWQDSHTLAVSPWPMNRETIDVGIAARRMADRKYADEQEMQAAYEQAPRVTLSFVLVPAK